jgi:hypothetical protein
MIGCSMSPVTTRESRGSDLHSIAEPGDVTAIEQPQSLFVNALPVRCCGVHRLTRLPRPESRNARRQLQRDLGMSVRDGGDFAYVAGEIEVEGGSHVQLACDVNRDLHLFDLRESLAAQARERSLDVRFGFAGEMFISGFANAALHDVYRVERTITLRVTDLGVANPKTVAIARHGTRWLMSGTLADSEVQRYAVAGSAVRLTGDGPTRGKVVSFAGGEVTLALRNEDVTVAAAHYGLRVNSGFVRQHHGTDILKRLQVASGSLTQMGRRNRFQVKDRFACVADDLEALGFEFPLIGGGSAEIEPCWIEVRRQDSE